MSTLKVTTIQDTANANVSTTEEIHIGRAKAWVNFNGGAVTSPFTIANGGIRDEFNVSSITDNGTGDHTLNFTTAFSDANYCVIMGLNQGASPNIGITGGELFAGRSTTALNLRMTQYASNADIVSVSVAIFSST